MPDPSQPLRKQSQRNPQMDFLRIVFSTLVLLSHAPEVADGNRSREIFSRITRSNLSFGSFAVDGCFLLSGFLIVQSWQRDPDILNFLRKRVLRIAPGYLVAAALGVSIVGLLAPGLNFMHRIPDISYGIYLYGWPVESLWIWYHPGGSPWITFLVATVICMLLGFLSWHFVERPALTLKRRPSAQLPPASLGERPTPA